jgi:hypothetical protein
MALTPTRKTAELHHLAFWQLDPTSDLRETVPGLPVWRLIAGNRTIISLHPTALQASHPVRRDAGLTVCWVVEFDAGLWDRDEGWHGGEYYDLDGAKVFFLAFWRDRLR